MWYFIPLASTQVMVNIYRFQIHTRRMYTKVYYHAIGLSFTIIPGNALWSLPNDCGAGAVSGWAGMALSTNHATNTVYLTGGYNAAPTGPCDYTDNHLVYKSVNGGLTWTLVSDTSDTGATVRSGQSSTVDSTTGYLYVVGGFSDDDGDYGTMMNDVWKSVDGGVTFTMVVDAAPFIERTSASLIMTNNGVMYMFGGTNIDWTITYADVWTSSNYGLTWTQVTADSSALITGFEVGVYDYISNAILLMGVSPNNGNNIVIRYTSTTQIGLAIVSSGTTNTVQTTSASSSTSSPSSSGASTSSNSNSATNAPSTTTTTKAGQTSSTSTPTIKVSTSGASVSNVQHQATASGVGGGLSLQFTTVVVALLATVAVCMMKI